MPYLKSGVSFLYDTTTGRISGIKSPDGTEQLFGSVFASNTAPSVRNRIGAWLIDAQQNFIGLKNFDDSEIWFGTSLASNPKITGQALAGSPFIIANGKAIGIKSPNGSEMYFGNSFISPVSDLIYLIDAYSRNLHPAVTYSRAAGSAMMMQRDGRWYDAKPGLPRWGYNYLGAPFMLAERAATNLCPNSSSGGIVAVTAQPYTISASGPCQVTLSGAYSGTLTVPGIARSSLTFTPSAGNLTIASSNAFLIQLETGSYATSPIPTSNGAVTRSADQLTIDNGVLQLGGDAGTVVSSVDCKNPATNPAILGTDAGWTPQYTLSSGIAFGAGVDGASTSGSPWPLTGVTSYGPGGCSALSTGSTESTGSFSTRANGFGITVMNGVDGGVSFLGVLRRQASAAERAYLSTLVGPP